MEVLFAAVVLIGLCVAGMCFNVIFRKNGRFPETEISRNREMRKRGITCVAEDERRLFRKKGIPDGCAPDSCADCSGCAAFTDKTSRDGKQ